MKNIIKLRINKDARIVCTVEKNKKTIYADFTKIIKEIETLSKIKDINLSIINGTITYSYKNTLVSIENYNLNRDKKLENIISRLKEKINRRVEELKNKKIKRKKIIGKAVFLSAVILSATITVGSIIIKLFNNNINFKPGTDMEEENKDYDTNDNIIIVNEDENKLDNYKKETIKVSYRKRTDSKKFKDTKNNYGKVIEKYAKMYGIDPQIILAIATQECGEHRINQNTPAIGLMQIEKKVWIGKKIYAFNYETNQYDYFDITEEKLNNLEFNIRVGCMHLQQCLTYSKGNLDIAIQMYNYGYNNIDKVLKESSNQEISLVNVENINDNEWLEYRKIIDMGDPLYLEHVLSYIENPKELKVLLNNKQFAFTIINIDNKEKSLG